MFYQKVNKLLLNWSKYNLSNISTNITIDNYIINTNYFKKLKNIENSEIKVIEILREIEKYEIMKIEEFDIRRIKRLKEIDSLYERQKLRESMKFNNNEKETLEYIKSLHK